MSGRKFFYKLPLIQMCVTLLIFLIGGFIFYLMYCDRLSKTYVTFKQNANEELEKKPDLEVIFSTPQDKFWRQGDGTYGAQFDGKFINNTNHVFTDWKVTIEVPEGYWVDSSWNAEFSYFFTKSKPIPTEHFELADYKRQYHTEENLIEMKKTSDARNDIMPKTLDSELEPFKVGMIMYTQYPAVIQYSTVVGRFIYEPREGMIYHILLISIFITTIILIVLIIIQISVMKQVKFYEVRQKLDSDIIVQSFKTFANFVDAKDPYTKGHSLRVAHYSREIARRMKMTEHEQMEMFWLALMHDVGKISVKDNILNKPSRLTDEEFTEIQSHVTKGYEMLNDFVAMPMLKEVAKSHHEHFDGTGYSEHLKGQEIPIEARIVCVSDSFDAMNSDRCYRKRLEKEQIIKEFEKCSGTHFDPKIAKIMIEMIKDKAVDKIESIDTLNDINYKA
ncbi:MAG: HD-GYP domain-containing protein [Treponema sp.]|nr:HD-GYP domain-containing protein [Candidatus Treponema merdequi]